VILVAESESPLQLGELGEAHEGRPPPQPARLPSAAGLARTLITQRLTKWGYQHLTDDAVLIATELIVNASEATPHEQIKFRLGRNTRGIFLAVWDNSPALPQPKPTTDLTPDALDATEETFDNGGGWGLHLIQALASTCGTTPDDRGGKWVHATLTV
jgi:hypothetical protein